MGFWKKRTGFEFRDQQSVIRPFRLPNPSVVNNYFPPESSMLSNFLHGISTVFSSSIFTVLIKEKGGESWPLAPPSGLSSDLHQFLKAISFPFASDWLRNGHKIRNGRCDLNEVLLQRFLGEFFLSPETKGSHFLYHWTWTRKYFAPVDLGNN